jgi:glycerophosphoryl diester phosphodiesterase
MSGFDTWIVDAPLVIAHRGASLVAPENTISAFQLAIELGADAIELDVKLSMDGIPVILHDRTLERTTNGRGRVKDLTLESLQALDAGISFHSSFKGERIPTLQNVIDQFGTSILMNIELTNYDAPFDQLPLKVLEIIDKSSSLSRFLISSFNPFALWTIHKANPEVRTALLLTPNLPVWTAKLIMRITPHTDLHPHLHSVDPSIIKKVKNSGGRVNVWTVNEYLQMSDLLSMGVDGIITDDVETAVQARRDVAA